MTNKPIRNGYAFLRAFIPAYYVEFRPEIFDELDVDLESIDDRWHAMLLAASLTAELLRQEDMAKVLQDCANFIDRRLVERGE